MSTRGERTKSRIVAAAEADLVAHDGIDVDRVAAAAEISVGGLYHHFASKDLLSGAVVAAFHRRWNEQVLYARFDGEWRERERIRRAVEFHYSEPLAEVLVVRGGTDGELARADARELEVAVRVSAANIAEAQRVGELSPDLDADLVGAMLIGGSRMVIARGLTLDPRPSADTVAEQLWAMCERVAALRSPV